jgi:sugar phosphate isomerase/epimerase
MNERIGMIAQLPAEGPILNYVADFGLKCCQLCSFDPDVFTDERADAVKRESMATGICVTSFWAGWPGPAVWDFVDGPRTLGIVPREYREVREAGLKRAGEFAKRAGLPAIVTHLGFIPENAGDPEFDAVVASVHRVAAFVRDLGVEFWFETGQETPVTMLRLIERVETGNLGINLDPANLILYGKGNPIDALDVFQRYVRGIHAKDGLYPTDPMKLGTEVKVGTGRVRFPEFVRRLEGKGFDGAYIIEREISGAEQRADIAATATYLEDLLERAASA